MNTATMYSTACFGREPGRCTTFSMSTACVFHDPAQFTFIIAINYQPVTLLPSCSASISLQLVHCIYLLGQPVTIGSTACGADVINIGMLT